MKEGNGGGAYLRSARKQSGRSLREVGGSVEPPIHAAYLSQIETGRVTYPSIELFERIATAYGVGLLDLMVAYGLEPSAEELEIVHATVIGRKILGLDETRQRCALSYVDFLQQDQQQAQASELQFKPILSL